jgi:hypothetical protein
VTTSRSFTSLGPSQDFYTAPLTGYEFTDAALYRKWYNWSPHIASGAENEVQVLQVEVVPLPSPHIRSLGPAAFIVG